MMHHPDCALSPDECRITTESLVQQPLITWQPAYDGNGMMTNSDPNTFVTTYTCATCAMVWEERRTGAEVTTQTLKPAQRPSA